MKNKSANRLVKILAWVIVVGCSAALVAIVKQSTKVNADDAWLAILSGILLTAVIYISTDFAVGRLRNEELVSVIDGAVERSIATHTVHIVENTPWGDLIKNAERIDFIVQGWNGWFTKPSVKEALPTF